MRGKTKKEAERHEADECKWHKIGTHGEKLKGDLPALA